MGSRAREKFHAELRAAREDALKEKLRDDLAAHVELFAGDEEIVMLPAAYMPLLSKAFESLYDAQWSAFEVTFNEKRRQVMRAWTSELSAQVSNAQLWGQKHFDKEISDLRLPCPSWVKQPESSKFSEKDITEEVSKTLKQAGYTVETTCGEVICGRGRVKFYEPRIKVSWA